MKIYVGHASSFDYVTHLYVPLKNAFSHKRYQLYLPHDANRLPAKSDQIIESSDIMLAEVSYPSLGLGIELG